MTYGKSIEEALHSGDRSVEQTIANQGSKINKKQEYETRNIKSVHGDPNPDVVDTTIDRPADGDVKVKEGANSGFRAVVDNDETAQEVISKGADKIEHPIEGNNGESKAERKAREAEEKRLKDLEVKSK